MALKITFLRLNGLLLASFSLFVFVYSDSDTLDDQVKGWMTHNCTFPPKSVYEEMDSILVPCFKNDVEIEYPLSFLCSSLIAFSNTLCIKRPKLKKYFTEESVQQKSNITNICSFAQYLIGDIALRKYLDKIITPTDMTSCRRYCEVEESAFAKICKLLIAGVAIYQERFLTLKAGNPGEKMQSPPPVTKGELKLNETKTQLGSDVKNASLLNTTVKPDIPVASSIENFTPLSIDTAPEISDTKPPTLPLSDVTNKIGPTITDSQPTSSQQKKPSDTYENHHPENEIKTTVSILPATDKQTFVPSTQDASTFITSTIGTTQPEYLDNHSEENINEPEGSDIEIKTSNDKLFQREPDAKSTETDNQDNDFEDTPDKEGEKKKTKDDSHNKTQKENTDDDSTQKENTDDDSTQKENTDDDSYNKSKNVQGNSDEDQNTENKLVLEDNQEIDQDRDIVPKSGVIQKMEESDDDSSSSSHFMAYFVTALVLCIAGYVIYHNKQKIIAFFLEGRRNGRRRAALGNTKYSKLTPSVEEVMPSLETAASAKNFIY